MPASPFARLFFLDVRPILKSAARLGGKLQHTDLRPLPPHLEPQAAAAALEAEWAVELAKPTPSLVLAVWRFYGRARLQIVVGATAMVCFYLAIPALMRSLIEVLERDGPLWEGMAYTAAVPVLMIAAKIVQEQCWNVTCTAAMRAWLACSRMIFGKPAMLTRAELGRHTEGKLLQLLSADCQAFLDVGQFIFFLAAMPLQAIVASAALVALLGLIPMVLGLGLLLANSWAGERLANAIKEEQVQPHLL